MRKPKLTALRRPLIAGNWKMHRTASDTRALIEDIVKKV